MAEEALYIEGARALTGEVEVQGSKNAALPMIAATILATEGQTILHRVPAVKDVLVAMELLRQLGATVDFEPTTGTAVIDTTQMPNCRQRWHRACARPCYLWDLYWPASAGPLSTLSLIHI